MNVSSRKAQALIAMLATSSGGERTRSWLQAQLWGSRGAEQAQASLRSELNTLRLLLNTANLQVICSDKSRVWLNLSLVAIDTRDDHSSHCEFLEGLDIVGEDGFEEWLRLERARPKQRASVARSEGAGRDGMLKTHVEPIRGELLPAVAVVPFSNLTGDDANGFVASGICDDLIDRLSRLRWLPIITLGFNEPSNSAKPDPLLIGRSANVRYVVAGKLRQQDGTQILSATLADCETGQTLWSSKLSFAYGAPEQVTDNLTTGLASALGAKIDQIEQLRAMGKLQSDLNVRELIWRGRWHVNRMTKEDAELGQGFFNQALAMEPNSPEALIQSIWAKIWDIWARRGSETEIRGVRQMAQKAIIADCDDARGHMLAGIAEIWLHQPLRAQALLTRAIELNPSLAMAHAQLGASLRVHGHHETAIAAFRIAMRLSPNDHDLFFVAAELSASLLMTQNYSEALVQADQAISRRVGYWFAHVLKVNALFRLERLDDAKAAYRELLAIKPDFRAEFVNWSPFTDRRNIAFLEEGLNFAAA